MKNYHRSKFSNLSNWNCLNWEIYCDDHYHYAEFVFSRAVSVLANNETKVLLGTSIHLPDCSIQLPVLSLHDLLGELLLLWSLSTASMLFVNPRSSSVQTESHISSMYVFSLRTFAAFGKYSFDSSAVFHSAVCDIEGGWVVSKG